MRKNKNLEQNSLNRQKTSAAWITPRQQVTAGIDAREIECREGYIIVIKASNGLPICVKVNSALKMIEKGLAVPAN